MDKSTHKRLPKAQHSGHQAARVCPTRSKQVCYQTSYKRYKAGTSGGRSGKFAEEDQTKDEGKWWKSEKGRVAGETRRDRDQKALSSAAANVVTQKRSGKVVGQFSPTHRFGRPPGRPPALRTIKAWCLVLYQGQRQETRFFAFVGRYW